MFLTAFNANFLRRSNAIFLGSLAMAPYRIVSRANIVESFRFTERCSVDVACVSRALYIHYFPLGLEPEGGLAIDTPEPPSSRKADRFLEDVAFYRYLFLFTFSFFRRFLSVVRAFFHTFCFVSYCFVRLLAVCRDETRRTVLRVRARESDESRNHAYTRGLAIRGSEGHLDACVRKRKAAQHIEHTRIHTHTHTHTHTRTHSHTRTHVHTYIQRQRRRGDARTLFQLTEVHNYRRAPGVDASTLVHVDGHCACMCVFRLQLLPIKKEEKKSNRRLKERFG
ncbi:unnamed protein product [Xylocopa violacea]|uniref:Uncharacterized protein n=1 Tax=Xylocopa violacea TaxID=135666 RepID=A0ABP1P9W8_XYLVO